MNFIFIPFIKKKETMYKINHFVPHQYSEKRQNEQNESFCPPPIF